MKNLSIAFLIMCLVNTESVVAQSSAFDLFNTSHFARTIRLGNAYTGVAEGPEALFYNAAGIAEQNLYSLTISGGQGYAIFAEETDANDFALIAPLPKNYGILGFAINSLSYVFFDLSVDKTIENIFSINYAKTLTKNLSGGITASYYYVSVPDMSAGSTENEIAGKGFDINLSLFYKFPLVLRINENDRFAIGFQIKNILNNKIKYNGISQDDYKFQNIRLGLSYRFIPDLGTVSNLVPVKFMTAFDAVFRGTNYEFYDWQPNYGFELTLLEILELSCGRENKFEIKDVFAYTPQYPVNRYGFGVNVPIYKIFNSTNKLKLKIDYSISDWQKIDEEKGRSEFYGIGKSIDKYALSASLFIDL